MFKSAQQLYNSGVWLKLIGQLKLERLKDGELCCEECGKTILKKYDCIGHHVIELTKENLNDYNISLNPQNIKLICFDCHNKKHKRFGYHKQCVYLVYGSPRAGKTTWVKQHAEKEDIILDVDKIWQMISINDLYIKPNKLTTPVFVIRDKIYDIIKTRTGKWDNAYIIGGYPYAAERERVIKETGATPVFIDETIETCMQRAQGDDRIEYEKYKRYITDWFANYQSGDPPPM